ncbi:excisionase family DNA binding protein [Bacteroides zoogleoformans]|uniref:DNA-binding protein n=1 Tax=Bacteroides zoogleoformans TaxID=28119 RepID=A0ABM6T6J5_9BACE|nr:helix-turn-helix domain-containing protein [Bacteroides zoogleoformans]AVM52413.1 DNA-binding protein [Bacteroides zoogleoformans]TWJ13336.1 excisionase family DNA binding protein [Bacteroides zoogleoformans]
MPKGNYTIQRSCEECGKIFTPPTLVSKYCCPACSKRAYKKRQVAKEKEAIRQALIRRIPSSKGYLTVKEAMMIYGISKDVLYRMIRQGLIPSYNFGQRLIHLSRQYMDEHFKTKAGSRKRKKEALSFEPKDCYTIGEIAKKFHINDSSVFKHTRRHRDFYKHQIINRLNCLPMKVGNDKETSELLYSTLICHFKEPLCLLQR